VTTPRRLGAVTIALALLMTVGCGLPEDSQPRPIADNLTAQLNQPEVGNAPANTVAGNDWIVYVVETDPNGERRLAEFPVATRGEPTPEGLLGQLLDTREANFAAVGATNLSNGIPEDVLLVDYKPEGDTATITLSPALDAVEGDTFRLAIAQMVYTVTRQGQIQNVRFRVGETAEDSDSLDVPAGPNETMDTVTRDDYEDLQPDLSN
jgi:hypothetical protein